MFMRGRFFKFKPVDLPASFHYRGRYSFMAAFVGIFRLKTLDDLCIFR